MIGALSSQLIPSTLHNLRRLDERPLTKSELRDYCGLLMGDAILDGMPDPSINWEAFLRKLDHWMKQKDEAPEQWVSTRVLVATALDRPKGSSHTKPRSIDC